MCQSLKPWKINQIVDGSYMAGAYAMQARASMTGDTNHTAKWGFRIISYDSAQSLPTKLSSAFP